jgi:hypothetical protein
MIRQSKKQKIRHFCWIYRYTLKKEERFYYRKGDLLLLTANPPLPSTLLPYTASKNGTYTRPSKFIEANKQYLARHKMPSFPRYGAIKLGLPIVGTTAAAFLHKRQSDCARCDAAAAAPSVAHDAPSAVPLESRKSGGERMPPREGMHPDLTGTYHGLFPMRQLWKPALEYPLWNKDWDGRHEETTGDPDEDRRIQRQLRKSGITRHIILVRHGQYDETFKVCVCSPVD